MPELVEQGEPELSVILHDLQNVGVQQHGRVRRLTRTIGVRGTEDRERTFVSLERTDVECQRHRVESIPERPRSRLVRVRIDHAVYSSLLQLADNWRVSQRNADQENEHHTHDGELLRSGSPLLRSKGNSPTQMTVLVLLAAPTRARLITSRQSSHRSPHCILGQPGAYRALNCCPTMGPKRQTNIPKKPETVKILEIQRVFRYTLGRFLSKRMIAHIISAAANHIYNLIFLGMLLMVMLSCGMRVFSWFKIQGLRTLEKFLFAQAIGIGIVGYALYFIGLAHLLNAWLILLLILAQILFFSKEFRTISNWLARVPQLTKFLWKEIRKSAFNMWMALAAVVFGGFGFIGAATPESQFDAIWYHLTLPKIYILDHFIHYVPGTLLYYSVFPRLTEMMYTLGLITANDIVAKMFHFAFGILFMLSIFALARRFFSSKVGLLAILVLCTTFEFIWLWRTAYIDLATAFFGTLACLAFLIWIFEHNEQPKERQKFLILTGIFTGLLLATKDWGLVMLPAIGFVILVKDLASNQEKKFIRFIQHTAIFAGIALVIALPWYIDAFINTGNPLYPIGAFHSPEDYGEATGAVDWFTRVWPKTFIPFTIQYTSSAFAPLMGLVMLTPFVWKRISRQAKYVFGLGGAYYFFYSFIPTHQHYRYSFGAVALLAILSAYLFFELFKNSKWLKFVGAVIIIVPLIIAIGMLGHLNKGNIRVFAGLESRDDYLNRVVAKNAFGFYDRDNYFAKNFGDGSKGPILTYNLHNLFYVNFPAAVYENNVLDVKNIHSAEDFVQQLKDRNIHYVMFKNSNIEALWDRMGKPSDFETFNSIFIPEYSSAQDSLDLYKVKE